MLFATSGVTVDPWVPVMVAFAISVVTSTGGVSGAFLLLPFQMSVLGFTSPAVSATNHLYNVIAIPSGVWRTIREGRMVWPLAAAVVVGTLPGVLIGAWVRVRFLPDPGSFKIFAGLVLGWIGIRLLRDMVRGGGSRATEAERRFREKIRKDATTTESTDQRSRVLSVSMARLRYQFAGEDFEVSTPGVLALSLGVGMIGGTYGIGGGAIMAPFFVSVLGLPVFTVTGAALAGTFVTSLAGVAIFQALAPAYPGLAVAPDWKLGLLFGLGGALGTYCGTRLQKHIPGRAIKWMLAAIILATALRYLAAVL
jgi:hypothetical protein